MTMYKELEEKELSVSTVQELYNHNTFEYCLIDNRLVAKTRNDLKLNYCKITADISNNKVIQIAEFYNCYFENMRIINNKFAVVKFKNCKFENISISKCVANEMIFENCIDTDEIDFTSNSIDLFNGAYTDESVLQMKNSIKKIILCNPIEKEDKSNITNKNNNRINNMEEKTDMEIVVQKDFENLTLTFNELNNKTYKNCNFFNCKFDESINLKANTDFISCRFDSCEISEGKYDKIAFDESEFFRTVFKGDFIRCTFCKCVFYESTITNSSHFFMCNFDNSNALSEFEHYMEHFTEIDFGKNYYQEKEEKEDALKEDKSDELQELLKPVYEYMKNKDDDLIKKIEEAKNSVNKKSVEKFLLDCNEQEFMLILSDVTMKRSSKYQNAVKEEEDVI